MRRPRRAPPLDPSAPCDVWTGARSRTGYGNVYRGGGRKGARYTTAHQAVWEDAVGPVPAGCELHHVCRNKLCRELRHLRLMTREAHRALHAAEATHCRNGHERTPENTVVNAGQRRCRECRTANRLARAA